MEFQWEINAGYTIDVADGYVYVAAGELGFYVLKILEATQKN